MLFLGIIVPLSILIPILFCIPKYKIAKVESRLLFYYLIISGLVNLAALILRNYHLTNLPLLHLYTAIEAVFILGYFRCIFEDAVIKKALGAVMIIFPILCCLNFIFLQRNTFNTYTRPLEAMLITFFCLLHLYKSGFSENWLKQPTNWFNAGILIYFPASFIIFISSNYLISSTNKTMNTMVWYIHGVLVMVMYFIWARGFKLIGNGR